ncbi:putative endoplasmic reticulum oxidoreductin [Cryptosporidium felis]|nr:putative endoplasmic reticulum oxidoreductin [Cryptosporidium felis]
MKLDHLPTADELFQDAQILQEKVEHIRLMNQIRVFSLNLSPGCVFGDKKDTCGDIGKCQVLGNESELSSTLFGMDKAIESDPQDSSNCLEKKTEVDMLKNPPSNTQYQGGEIWNRIYKESERIDFPLLEQLISGVQSNIAVHASERYKKIEGRFDYSLSNFMYKFVIFEERGTNLLITFYFVVKSICVLGPQFENFMEKYLDNSPSNIELKNQVKSIFDPTLYNSCNPRYENNIIPSYVLPKLEAFFKVFLSSLGCVECEKCILHGTIKGKTLELATKGIGGSKNINIDPLTFVTYLNGLYIFSTSVTIIDVFTSRVRYYLFYSLLVLIIAVYIFKIKFNTNRNLKNESSSKMKRD